MLCIFMTQLSASSVYLFNDSPYDLKIKVLGNDGTLLGELVLGPQRSTTWKDSFGQIGVEQHPRSLTPYSIFWYCMNDDEYSSCNKVYSEATITARGCKGPRLCQAPPKKKPGELPSPQEGQYLHPEEPYSQ